MTWYEVNDVIVITLPEDFDIVANMLSNKEKNECMYVIENDVITKVIVIGEIRSLVQINVMNNKQMNVQKVETRRDCELYS